MTIKQVAEKLGVAPSRIRHDVLDGRLKASKEGRDLFVAVEEFERYSKARRPRGRPKRQVAQQ